MGVGSEGYGFAARTLGSHVATAATDPARAAVRA